MNGHSQHFWETIYLVSLHAMVNRAASDVPGTHAQCKAHADAAVKHLDARVEQLERDNARG